MFATWMLFRKNKLLQINCLKLTIVAQHNVLRNRFLTSHVLIKAARVELLS